MNSQISILVFSTIFSVPISLCLLSSDLPISTEQKQFVQPFEDINKGWTANEGGGLKPEIPPNCLDPKNLPLIDPSAVNHSFDAGFFTTAVGAVTDTWREPEDCLGGRRNVYDRNELFRMCPALAIDAYPVIFSGYGLQIDQNCTTTGLEGFCHISNNPKEYDGQFGVDPTAGYVTLKFYLLATDNESYGIYYLCIDGVYGDYMLLTTTPFVPPQLAQQFVDFKNRLGFSHSELLFLVCTPEKENKPYPPPFQNYPAFGVVNGGWSQSQSHNGWSS